MRILSFITLTLILAGTLIAQSPHEKDLNIDCSKCHSETSWTIDKAKISFNHSETKFSLEGQHQSADCKSCHSTLIFKDADTDCQTCHKDIHQGTVGFDCARCHTPQSWLVKDMNNLHQMSRFPLLGAHLRADCVQCHSGYPNFTFEPQGTNCFDCHSADYFATQNPNHTESQFSTDCQECHNLNSLNWAADNFNHDFFPLVGGHKISTCFSCHQPGTFTGLSTDCYACHKQDYDDSVNPNHIAAEFSIDCTECHDINAWSPANFDHNLTNFPLTGKHVTVDCQECHATTFTGTPTDCFACHEQDYNTANDPNHIQEGFPTDCTLCHNTNDWNEAQFDHNLTAFPLTGKHITVDCQQCHTNGYTGTPTDCFACHEQDYNGTTDPNHLQEGYPTDCTVCHTTAGWSPSNFDHNNTNFPLTGKHLTVDCQQCHTNGYTGTPTDCFACHEQDYNGTTDPNHLQEGYPTDCTVCHTTAGWSPSNFDHNNTNFPLTGKHLTVDCQQCHTNGYTGTPTDCFACHEQDYNGTTDPNHLQEGYPTDCTVCHTTAGWSPSNFDHNNTNFPLTGKHLTVDCQQCHTNGYTGTPTDCFACHEQDYNGTTDPNHLQEGYPTDCTVCHTTAGWSPSNFDHNNTNFPLTGKHLTVDCQQCHTNGYTGTPTDCYACHQQDYENAVDPNHIAAGFPTTCEDCHTTSGWTPANFDHDGQYFPIYSGKHNGEWNDCADCHTNQGDFSIFSCITCHEHNQTDMDDEHQGVQGYIYQSEECYACHPDGKADGAFDHQFSNFPLTGGHLSLDCIACHQNGYEGTSTICSDCHQTDFNNTTNPNHQTLGIAITCETCHTTNPNWSPALFPQHDQYFLLTGAHAQISNDCESCHNGNYNNPPNECVGCHQSDYDGAVNPNHQAAGLPTNCESCHTTTAWVPSTFNHTTTGFELTGQHAVIQCSSCHQGTVTGLSSDCISCHQSDYNIAPDHVAQGYPTNCEMCHNASAWSDVTFDHQTTNFPLTGAHLTVTCSQCHANGFEGTPTNCDACHMSNYNQSTNPSHTALQLPTTCETCHTTNPGWAPATFPIHNDFYQLIGAHAAIANDCASCHNGDYNNTPNTCFGCHDNDFNATNDPPHVTLNFNHDCLQCHTQTAWTPASFDHNFYPISSQHNNVDCGECHSQANYQPQCLSCHLDDFNDEHDPGDPTNCWECHSTSTWDGALFDHNTTNFPLTGAHLTVACESCHANGYSGTPTNCDACHITAYNATQNPNHPAAGLPLNCESCHTTTAWIPSTFNHATTGFELQGVHAQIQCSSCHQGTVTGLNSDCISCHMSEFKIAPNHLTQGYPTNCEMCHNASAWSDVTFDHQTTNFPLTGAHLTTDCSQCHANGFEGTPTQCLACHKTDYSQTTNPSHTVLALPTTCETCHTTNPGWAPATFPIHNDFYQLIGAHASIANDCASCHNGDYNNTPNTCFGCHDNDFNGTNDPPHVTLNFNHDCLECHTQTGWTPATFNHNFFTLHNPHNNFDCSDCHSGSNYDPQCLSCHMEDFLDEHDPGDRTDCWSCHNTDDWDNRKLKIKGKRNSIQ